MRGATQTRSRVTSSLERLLDVVSVSSLVLAIAVAATIALLRLRRDLALAAVVVVLGSNATSQVLKHYVLSRPDLGILETTPATLNSLPSGHSTAAFSVAVALVLVLPAPVRPVAAATGVAYASLAAVATLSAGWHRPSDSLAAFLIVGAWAAAAEAVVTSRSEHPANRSHFPPGAEQRRTVHLRTAHRLATAAAYLLAFGALIAVVVVTTHLDSYGGAAQVLSYVAAAGLIAGTAAAVMASLVVPLAEIRPAEDLPAQPEVEGETRADERSADSR